MSTLWKIFCEENKYPGLWQHWYKNQCVAIGWEPPKYRINENMPGEKGWNEARKAVLEMKVGDFVVVALSGHRLGRLGQITDKKLNDDEWKPLVPKNERLDLPLGDLGRRILVRWELTTGPDSQDYVVQLPEGKRFNSGELLKTVSRIKSIEIKELRVQMKDRRNWVSLRGKFDNEKALSDYIAKHPHRLEDGLLQYPNLEVREKVFEDKTRLDVLLMDEREDALIVECKQNAPTLANLAQLRGYMENFKEIQPDKQVRGILVHGGPQKISEEIIQAAKQSPAVELVSYTLEVNFRPSS